jgi:hypothetical protein
VAAQQQVKLGTVWRCVVWRAGRSIPFRLSELDDCRNQDRSRERSVNVKHTGPFPPVRSSVHTSSVDVHGVA